MDNNNKVLWSFNWKQGGFNAVWAGESRKEALEIARKQFPSCGLEVDEQSLVPRRTREEQNAYWDSIPFMD